MRPGLKIPITTTVNATLYGGGGIIVITYTAGSCFI